MGCVVSPVSKTADSILGSPSMNGGVEKPFVAVTKMEPLDSTSWARTSENLYFSSLFLHQQAEH